MRIFLREQFVDSCSEDLAVFLQERAPVCLAELTKIEEQYLQVHKKQLATSIKSSHTEGKKKPKNMQQEAKDKLYVLIVKVLVIKQQTAIGKGEQDDNLIMFLIQPAWAFSLQL